MKILHISDSHGFHNEFRPSHFEGVDMVIHSGDCSNSNQLHQSIIEIQGFLNWYETVPVKHKIFVAGNHDTAIERKQIEYSDTRSLYFEVYRQNGENLGVCSAIT